MQILRLKKDGAISPSADNISRILSSILEKLVPRSDHGESSFERMRSGPRSLLLPYSRPSRLIPLFWLKMFKAVSISRAHSMAVN